MGHALPPPLPAELADRWSWPGGYVRIVELGLVDLEPWYFLGGEELAVVRAGLAQRYPERELLPFARRQDGDDVACFDLLARRGDPEVLLIHDHADAGWELGGELSCFWDWFRQAVEDVISWSEEAQ